MKRILFLLFLFQVHFLQGQITICSGTSINVSTTGYESSAGYVQNYILVNGAGTIITHNTSGNFSSTDYGASCVAACYDGENCYNFSGETPFKKIYKKERAKRLIQKLANQKAGAYEKIYNPLTRRWVSSSGIIGRNILQKYLSHV